MAELEKKKMIRGAIISGSIIFGFIFLCALGSYFDETNNLDLFGKENKLVEKSKGFKEGEREPFPKGVMVRKPDPTPLIYTNYEILYKQQCTPHVANQAQEYHIRVKPEDLNQPLEELSKYLITVLMFDYIDTLPPNLSYRFPNEIFLHYYIYYTYGESPEDSVPDHIHHWIRFQDQFKVLR